MDDLASRKQELYRAYDEAALCILMDRYGEAQGDQLIDELGLLREEERSVPGGEEQIVSATLALCAKKKRAAARRSAVLHTVGKVAVVLLILGCLAGYAAHTAFANQERSDEQAKDSASAFLTPEGEAGREEPGETERGSGG